MSDPVDRPLALVTGASRGLGRLCALELAKAGARVLLVGRDEAALASVAQEIAGLMPQAETFLLACDLGEGDAAQRLNDAALERGGADILVNNAAVQGPIGPAWEVPTRDFEETICLDFLVPVRLCRALMLPMTAKGRGWIVNISGGGATGPRPMFAAYGAAKTALVRFSESLAAEAAPFGVRVNAVAPGAFTSGMTRAVKIAAAQAGASEAALADKLLAKKDEANAEKAARLVAYLTLGPGRDVSGKLISAVWDRWDLLHCRPEVAKHKDVFTLRRIVPEERNLKLSD